MDVARIYSLDRIIQTSRNKTYPVRDFVKESKWELRGKSFCRVAALCAFVGLVKEYGLGSKKLLTFNASNDPEILYLPHTIWNNYNYEDDPNRYDLHALNLNDKDYDFCIMCNTIEHLYDPIRCVSNIFDHLVVGGFLYLLAPVNSIPHSEPYHFYTGFTAMGLCCVVESAGFLVRSIGQWGNKEYVLKMVERGSWPDYRELDSYDNDRRYPVTCWVLAEKVGGVL